MPNLIGGLVLGYVWQLLLNGILAQFQRNLKYSEVYGFVRTCDPDVLAADWLYDDHLYFRYSEYPGRAD